MLRLALNSSWYISNDQIRRETKMTTLEEIIEARKKNLIVEEQKSRNTDSHKGTISRHYKNLNEAID